MPFSSDAIANWFIDKAAERGKQLTPMQLQKLVFYTHGWHLALDPNGRPLIPDPCEAWKYGPVVRSLYREFREFANAPVSRRARDIQIDPSGGGRLKLRMSEPSVADENPGDIDKPLALAILNRVWEIYGGFTAYQLSNMTHAEGEPWRIIWDAMPTPIPTGVHIPNEVIRECFRKKLEPPQSN